MKLTKTKITAIPMPLKPNQIQFVAFNSGFINQTEDIQFINSGNWTNWNLIGSGMELINLNWRLNNNKIGEWNMAAETESTKCR